MLAICENTVRMPICRPEGVSSRRARTVPPAVLVVLTMLSGCSRTFTDLTISDASQPVRFFADAQAPKGCPFLVPQQEISEAQASMRPAFFRAAYDRKGLLLMLSRHVRTPYGVFMPLRLTYRYDPRDRRVREIIEEYSTDAPPRFRDRVFDEKGNLIAERPLDSQGRPIPDQPPRNPTTPAVPLHRP